MSIPVRYSQDKAGAITFHTEYHDIVVHPSGFESVYYQDMSKSKEIDKFNRTQYLYQQEYQVKEVVSKLKFWIESGYPSLPLKRYGEIWTTGWDIPTRYAIDAKLDCWMDDAHGGCLQRVQKTELLSEFQDKKERIELEKFLGLEPSFVHCPCCNSLITKESIKPVTTDANK